MNRFKFLSFSDKLRVNFKTIDPQEIPTVPHTPYELEKMLLKVVPLRAGEFIFAEWKNLTDEVLITSSRIAFISADTSGRRLENVLRNVIFQEHRLNVVYHLTRTFDELKRFRATGEAIQPYTDVVVTVINPDAKEQTVEWDVQSAAESESWIIYERIKFY